jgi:hypothetical protein
MSYLLIEKRTGGLMSCFNLIAASLSYLYDNQINNFYFIWNSATYQNNPHDNLFDKFIFKQTQPSGTSPWSKVINVFELSHHFYAPVVPQEKVVRIHNILQYYHYFSNPIYQELFNTVPNKPKTLGVHVRRTDHAIHGDILPDEYYFEKIDANLKTGKYENIFLATDEYKIVDAFKNKYGNMLFTNENITRSNNDVTIPFCNYEDKDKLALDIFKEGIALSRCDKMIFTSSNIPNYVRFLSPNMDCEQIDTHIQFR